MLQFLTISGGAILGANLRYWVSLWAVQRWGSAFPFGTFLVNSLGCLLIGLFYGLGEARMTITPELRLFFAVGFLGAFTTFSTFGWESLSQLRNGDLLLALGNILGSNLIGLAAVLTGLWLARLLT